MAQVAFDTQEFVDTLEKEGLPRNQAKAITLVVRKSHEVADLATKEDIKDVKRDLEDVRKDVEARFDKTDAKITDVRKDLSAEIADVRKDMEYRFDKNKAQMAARFEKVETQIADVRKDMNNRFEQIDKRLDFSEKRFERLAIKFDRLQWFILAGILGLLFKDVLLKLWGG